MRQASHHHRRELGYRPQYVYAWLQDRTPDYDNLRRLSRDLDTPVAWLVSGDHHAAATTTARRAPRDAQRGRRPLDEHDNGAAAPATGMVDVRRLHEAAEHMLAVQADLDAALAAFPDPCLWLDEAGRVLAVHGPADPNILSPLAGELVREAMPPEAATAFHRALTQVLRTGAAVTTEFIIATATRAQRVYEVRLAAVRNDARPRRLFAALRDVTDLRTRETEYRQLVDGSPNGLCIHRDYVILFANRAIARLFGYTRAAELVGRDIRSLVPEHRAPAEPQRVRTPVRHEYRAVTRDGEPVALTGIAGSIVWGGELATILTVLPRARAESK